MLPFHVLMQKGGIMNRRHFLGLALSTAAAPVFAAKHNHTPRHVLALHNLHTNEQIEVAYRIGDYYQRDALRKLNRFLRDYRTEEIAVIDPKLFDLLYDLQKRTRNSDGEFEIYSGYRSPQTNAMLRRHSKRVAKHSLHMSGKAIDLRLCGCSISRIRDTAVAMGRGGVGYYPRSNFVHVDTGPFRTWRA
jgi:uncharacterized protein YcbK (DUF882 family)